MESVNESLAKAWEKFDHGDYTGAESLYLFCYDQISQTDTQSLAATLMGLVYVETFLNKCNEARKYGYLLLNEAKNNEEKHIVIHQLGMVERMAGNYSKAMVLFLQVSEEERNQIYLFEMELDADTYDKRDMRFYDEAYEAMDEHEDVKTVLACARRYFSGEQTAAPVWEILSDKSARAVKDITNYLRGM